MEIINDISKENLQDHQKRVKEFQNNIKYNQHLDELYTDFLNNNDLTFSDIRLLRIYNEFLKTKIDC